MDLSLGCACGVELQAEDITPAVAELLFGMFDVKHGHDDERAALGVTTGGFSIVNVEGDSDEEDVT